jgi:hypothetical protein
MGFHPMSFVARTVQSISGLVARRRTTRRRDGNNASP